MIQVSSGDIITLLGIAVGVLTTIITWQRTRIREINNQLSEKKYALYHEVYSVFFGLISSKILIDAIEGEKEKTIAWQKIQDDLVVKLLAIKKDWLQQENSSRWES